MLLQGIFRLILCYIFFAKRTSSNGIEKYPQLRFNGYSNPWTTQKLGDLGTFIKGAPLSKADISDEGNPFILYGELYTTYSEVTHSVKRKTDKTVEQQFYSKIGDVIMPTSGETPEDIATASCIMLPDVILAGDLLIYRTEQIDGRFVSYAIKNKVNKQISSVAQGKSVVHVRADELAKICITFPALDEQKKILNLLELLDTRIATQQSLIETLKKYKRGVTDAIFCRKLCFADAEDSYPEWTCKKVGEVCKIQTGKSNTQDEIENGAYNFYVRSPIVRKSNRYLFDCEAVLTVGDGVGTGKVFHYVNEKFDLHQRVYAMTNFTDVSGKYFYFYFSHFFYDRVMRMTAKTSVDSVRYEMIDQMNILVPCEEEQKRIVGFLSSLDQILERAETALTSMETMKKGLLQQLFI